MSKVRIIFTIDNPNHGYYDRFGNEWVKGPSRARGKPYEWGLQLSPAGQKQFGAWSKNGKHLNVSLKGKE